MQRVDLTGWCLEDWVPGHGCEDKEHISNDGPVVGTGPNSVVNRRRNPVLDVLERASARRGSAARSVPIGYDKILSKTAKTFLPSTVKRDLGEPATSA